MNGFITYTHGFINSIYFCKCMSKILMSNDPISIENYLLTILTNEEKSDI